MDNGEFQDVVLNDYSYRQGYRDGKRAGEQRAASECVCGGARLRWFEWLALCCWNVVVAYLVCLVLVYLFGAGWLDWVVR